MSTEVTTIDMPPVRSANPMDMMPADFRSGLQRRGENRKALMEWVRGALVDGVDFGKIHFVAKSKCGNGNNCTNQYHFSKPVLFKPGAEKICGMLGITPTFPTLKDYEQAVLEGREIRQVILRCHLIAATGEIVADGVGARSVEQDYGDLNKTLKMAEKSAHIDSTLRMAGLSEVFTQDLEDMPKERAEAPATAAKPAAQPAAQKPQGTDLRFVSCGKHKGRPWADVGEDYLNWCVTANKAPLDLVNGAKAELELRRNLVQSDFDEELPPSFHAGEQR